MKRKLLFLFTAVLFSGAAIQAQTKVWDFSGDATTWPISTGIGSTEIVKDMLGLFPISTNTNFGAISAGAATFSDGYTSGPNRFQMNGGGGAAASTYLPTQRYLYFTVDGPCTVKVWFRHGSSSGVDRSILVTDGTNLIGTAAAAFSSNAIVSANYTTVGGGKLYIYGDAACNLYKIEVTGANVTTPALSTDHFAFVDNQALVYAKNQQVFVSNLKSNTEISVYNMLGSLVKNFKTDADIDFNLKSGLYIVKAQSEEGVKSVKLAVN